MLDLFDRCKEINILFNDNNDIEARELLINLLDDIKNKKLQIEPYQQFLAHLIRRSGIYPYLNDYIEEALLEDKLVYSLFTQNDIVLHREQYRILSMLLNGDNILLSAPTSFGKSYIIDNLIAIKKPKNIMIIVPTIALLDETRKRLYKKFSKDYNIITTVNQYIGNNNIFILTQERALSYKNYIHKLDLLIVDEFYKVEYNKKDDSKKKNDYKRTSILQKIIFDYNTLNPQKYFICPNVDSIEENPFEVKFEYTNFNTVIVNEHHLYDEIQNNNKIKNKILKDLLNNNLKNKKNIIYINIVKIINELYREVFYYFQDKAKSEELLHKFIEWIKYYYTEDFIVYKLLKKGVGIHNAQIHRFLSQIQIKIFNDEKEAINTIIATSTLIEGVNTQAENIILYSNKIANRKINRFVYNNIKGRAGRMFKYYKGNIYLLENLLKIKNIL